MRIAAIYDIHGNLPALEAVLHDIKKQKIDLVVASPMTTEALLIIQDYVNGNTNSDEM